MSRVLPHNLTEPGLIFHVPPIELRQLCVDSLKFRMDRPAPNWAASKWQHVRAQLAIVVADGAQICHQADCQLKIQPGLPIPLGLQEKLGILPESWISARKWMRQIKAKCCDGVGKIWEVQKVENDIVRVIYKSP